MHPSATSFQVHEHGTSPLGNAIIDEEIHSPRNVTHGSELKDTPSSSPELKTVQKG